MTKRMHIDSHKNGGNVILCAPNAVNGLREVMNELRSWMRANVKAAFLLFLMFMCTYVVY